MEQLLSDFGFRSIIGKDYQSWSVFTSNLFADDKKRGEFDIIRFFFDLDEESPDKHIQINEHESDSLTTAFFGRPIDITTFRLPIKHELKDKLTLINNILPDFYTNIGKNKLSQPTFVIDNIDNNSVTGYYIWQFK